MSRTPDRPARSRLSTFETLIERFVDPTAGPGLNVGCGWDVRPGFVNLDLATLPGVDVSASIGGGLPFRDESFDVVLAKDVVEHLDDTVGVLTELHRVMRPGALLLISTVHFTSRDLFVDPTHRRGFSIRTFDFFVPGGREVDRTYYSTVSFAAVEAAIIQFHAKLGQGRFLLWDWVLEPLVNLSPVTQDLYEMTAASRAFPAGNVLVALRK